MNETLKLLLIEDDVMLSSSSSSSDEYEDMAVELLPLLQTKGPRTTIKKYIIDVVNNYREDEFTMHFRMNREKVREISEKFRSSDMYQSLLKTSNTRAKITAEEHVLIFLWFAGHQTCFRDVADRFDLSLSSLHDVITRIIQFLNLIASEIIYLPSALQKENISTFYYNKTYFPHVIGCIDGSHIKIEKPTERSIDYFNRKDYYSIVLQGVCDHNLNFTDVFIGYPGSTHDTRIFRNSIFYNEIEPLCSNGYYILGDSAYPLLPQLLTPYRDNGHLTRAQKFFNKKLSSCRVSIEHSFGLLKQRFRQLYNVKLRGHERICRFILACCVLHNIASKDDHTIFSTEEQMTDNQPDDTIPTNNEETGAGIRDELCRQLYTQNLNQRL